MKKDACRFSSRVVNQGAKVILAYDVKKDPLKDGRALQYG
jgi:hypothetical protein